MKKFCIVASVVGLCALGSAQGFTEDFESYADQNAFNAVWYPDTIQVFLRSNPLVAHSGSKYAEVSTGIVQRSTRTFNITPTTATPLMAEWWVRIEGSALGRNAVYINNATSDTITAFGGYNNPATSGWHRRVVGLGGDGVWSDAGGTRGVAIWKKLGIKMYARAIEFYENGTLLYTDVKRTSNSPAMTQFRIGIALSTNAAALYDDVTVSQGTSSGVADWNLY